MHDLNRRSTLIAAGGFLFAAATASACSAATRRPLAMTVHKDPNCGCCTAWADAMRATGTFEPRIVEQADMAALKTRLGVPPTLASCHTTEVAGYVIEGHVPAAHVVRLIETRPKGLIGLAVPGMPAGSPGMEMPDGRRDAFKVLAFTADGRASVFG